MKTKLSPRFWLVLTVFGLVGQIAWVVENMYFNVFIYEMFKATPSDIALMVGASAVAATLTTVFMGALSDRIGKRKLFMCGGYILWGISIFSFVLIREDVINAIFPAAASAMAVGVSLVIIMDCVMTFFGSTANDAAFNAWLTDSTDDSNRGAAEGINAMMPLVAILAVFGGFMFLDQKDPERWTLIFSIIGAVTLAVGVLGLFIIKEPDIKPSSTGYFSNIVHGFLPSSVKRSPTLYIALGLFVIFNISIQIFMPYLIIYYDKTLGMSDYVMIMAPAIVLASVVTALWGKVYDKKGFNFSVTWSMIWLCAGYILLIFFTDKLMVFVGSLLMMCGYLSGMAVFGARIRDNIPEGKAGSFQGVRIVSQVLLPGILGPYIGKSVLKNCRLILNDDGTTSFLPNQNIFIAALVTAAVLCVALILLGRFRKDKPRTATLTTPFEEGVGEIPHPEYPRPSLRRNSYMSLNGKWELSVLRKEKVVFNGDILVPFPPESKMSGVYRQFGYKDTLIYRRSFTLPEGFMRDRLILHFGAVDRYSRVNINGKDMCEHNGGYLPFEVDITDALVEGENIICVEVFDDLDTDYPYGKQSKKRGGMWYTPISGIWQSVWLESVPENYIRLLKITPALDCITIQVDGGVGQKTLIFEGKEYSFLGDNVTLDIESPRLWTPDAPNIYEFELVCGSDRVQSYFALRTVSIERRGEQSCICLNGEPVFLHGLLDQGYYSDGIYTPATVQGYKNDILKMKELGFNLLRKHIKVEPELFYYYCDIYGMLVAQDMVNCGKYSFLIDTALPTIGFKRGKGHRATKRRREIFESEARTLAEHLYNHPSVIYYTIFNEGWGQYDADRIYGELKALDPSRVWDATSGWFKSQNSDVQSEHIYFKSIRLKQEHPDRPIILSEFGGYSYKIAGHSFNPDNTYGYRFFSDGDKFRDALVALYKDEIIPAISSGLCGAVLTQVSDVEDETNGLLTYDRQVLKVDTEQMREVAESIECAFEKKFSVGD